MPPKATSWPDWTYPKWRDKSIITSDGWLEGRRSDDGAEGLWRIHDGLYDLTDFTDRHPGGSDWLQITKGMDITEAFEVHHIGPQAESLLPKFFVRSAKCPRNSPFTFNKTGFYNTLKKRVYEIIKNKRKSSFKSLIILDSLVAITITLSLIAAFMQSVSIYIAYLLCIPAGLFLCFTSNCSHNFIHQRNNWRMYYFNLSLMSVREWKVIHVLSHHLFANTMWDLEMGLLEPWLQWLPQTNKSWIVRYFSLLYSPAIYPLMFHVQAIQRLFKMSFQVQNMIGLILPVTMVAVGYLGNTPFYYTLILWTWLILCGSFFFGFIGVSVAHHHPDIFHDGDAPRADRDWGLNQIDAVGDRVEFRGCLFVTLVTYGHHTLHHLFPTLDHTYLDDIYPELVKTCGEFGCVLTVKSAWDLLCGQFRQLMRNIPNPLPPDKK